MTENLLYKYFFLLFLIVRPKFYDSYDIVVACT